ncbi:MAG: hypothetical protein J6V01_08515 [Clostridia bacterium]|nr:hypothetical protein [Clostridia bacterium]
MAWRVTPAAVRNKAKSIEKGGVSMGLNEGKTYAGRIKNSGSQVVSAIFEGKAKAKSQVIKGEDLRAGK